MEQPALLRQTCQICTLSTYPDCNSPAVELQLSWGGAVSVSLSDLNPGHGSNPGREISLQQRFNLVKDSTGGCRERRRQQGNTGWSWTERVLRDSTSGQVLTGGKGLDAWSGTQQVVNRFSGNL